MKNSIFLFLFVLCSLLSDICKAQWQPDVRLTNDTSGSFTFRNSVAAFGSVVHVVWYDERDGSGELYYKRSTDGGVSWGTDTRLTNNSAVSESPSVSVSGTVVHVVWEDQRDGNAEVYYKRSIDGGVSWGADIRLTNHSARSVWPSVSVSASVVHVVWMDERDGNDEIYYKRSTDGGVSWGTDTRLTINSAQSYSPSVSVSGSVVHVVWEDSREVYFELYYKRSTDAGVSWGTDTRLTNNSAYSWWPSVSVSGTVVLVVWHDFRDGNAEIYYKRSTDGGVSWGTDTRLTINSAESLGPSVSVSGSPPAGGVHVVWWDSRDGNFEIYYKRSTDGGVSWETDTRLTNNSAYSGGSSVSLSGTVVHVVWTDNRDGNFEIYYKRDPTGNPVGIININSELPKEFKLGQNYPNPFNPKTIINFQLPPSNSGFSYVTLNVYDVLGRGVVTLVNEELKPGTYEVDWNAENYPSGVYYYKLTAGDFNLTKRMILLK